LGKNGKKPQAFAALQRSYTMANLDIDADICSRNNLLEKSPTGVKGLDEITDGGLPKGRPTLVCGSAGSGKTLLSMQFLAQGALMYDEPGVFIAFEETSDELTKNFSSLGFDLKRLQEMNKILIDMRGEYSWAISARYSRYHKAASPR